MNEKKVFHKRYGAGKIVSRRYGGFEVKVLFEDGLKRWIKTYELEDFSNFTPRLETLHTRHTPLDSTFSAREIIESLRLGIVPYKYVTELTLGRDREWEQVKNWLLSNTGTLVVKGEYGTGKSHFLQYIYSMALKEGWGVSIINLDINEVSFFRPKNIYKTMVANFRYRDDKGLFRDFLKELSKSDKSYLLEEHVYLYEVIRRVSQKNDDEVMWNWIEGLPVFKYKPTLYEYSTCGNIYSYIITGIGWALKNILGMKGFLILFDEAESVDPYWYRSYQNMNSQNFLKGLIMAVNAEDILLEERKELSFNWRHRGGYVGSKSGLKYCGRSKVPFLWKSPSCTKLIFALPPMSKVPKIFEEAKELELYPLNITVMKEFSYLLSKIYYATYNFECNLPDSVFQYKRFRTFAKAIIEFLDIERFKK